MLYGICNLSIVAIREDADENSAMLSQLLFGESFLIIEQVEGWSKIQLDDLTEGFIDNKQFEYLSEQDYTNLLSSKVDISAEIIDYVTSNNTELFTIPLGAYLPNYVNKTCTFNGKNFVFEGKVLNNKLAKTELVQAAFMYLNSPFLSGGKTPFGIDSSGLAQMVYKLSGYNLPRKAKNQAKLGEVLSFIEESEAGDLAFFDNEEGEIIHVGIILNDYHIIHSYGKVRIDTLDHSGIFNTNLQKHTHKLRVIKKII